MNVVQPEGTMRQVSLFFVWSCVLCRCAPGLGFFQFSIATRGYISRVPYLRRPQLASQLFLASIQYLVSLQLRGGSIYWLFPGASLISLLTNLYPNQFTERFFGNAPKRQKRKRKETKHRLKKCQRTEYLQQLGLGRDRHMIWW